jgi:hypothetical protein
MACQHCGKKLKVRDDLVGRTARCPHCRGAIAVQRPSSNELDQLDEEEDGSVDLFGSAPAAPKPGAGVPPTAAAGKRPVPLGAGAASVGPGESPPSAAKPAAGGGVSSVISDSGNTDVSVPLYMVAGIAGTALFYLLIYPFAWTAGKKLTYLGRLFIGASSMSEGGWVPIAEVFIFFWAIGMLVAKYFKIRRQQRAMLLDVLPTEIGTKITTRNLDAFLANISQLPKDAANSFLVTRRIRGLEHFRARKSAADTATMLASQSDLDASSVDASYTMFHVFIWAIPILGFLGTVIGVSAA